MESISPKRAIAIVAHPDDVEYYCGGTLAKWIGEGCEVTYIVATSGDKGSNDLAIDVDYLISTREHEQRASAKTLGVKEVIFLRYPDSELDFVNLKSLRGEFVRNIRRTCAQVILTHDPLTRLTRQHPDHRIVGKLTMDASFPLSSVARCYEEHILEEGLKPNQPSYLFFFGTDQPNHWVNIEATLEQKIQSLERHESQTDAFDGGIAKRLRWRAKTIGERYGVSAAEEFLVIKVGPTLPDS